MKNCNDKIAITGMSMLSPFGFGLGVFHQALENGVSTIRHLEETHPEESQVLSVAGFLPVTNFVLMAETLPVNGELKKKFIELIARAPLTIQASLLVAMQAYLETQLSTQNPQRIGIIIAGNNTSQKQSYLQQKIFTQMPERVSPRYALNVFDSSHIGYVSELLSITGEGHVIGAASASGNMALIQATRLLQLQVIDHCIVIGVLADLSVVELQAFRQVGALGGIKFKDNPQYACRPFDSEHEGFIPGQIAACVILERQNQAKERQMPIKGYIAGYGVALDAQHSTEASANGELRAMQGALDSAGLNIKNLDYINAHGTSSQLGDQIETKALLNLLDNIDNPPFINSTKSITGHCLFSAGIVEAIASCLQLQNGFLHPTLNLENAIVKNLPWVSSTIYGHFNTAMSNNFAFGGINTSVIFEKGDSACV